MSGHWEIDGEWESCTWCDGYGEQQCDDPIQCCDPRCDGQTCICGACNGSGLRRDQVIF